MLPSHRTLPLPYHLFNLAGRQADRLGLRVGDIRLETLIKDAQRITGLDDFGSPYFQTGLEKLLDSLKQDAHLRFYGRLVMRFMLSNYLTQRLLFVDAQKHRLEEFKPLKQSPIMVTGLHRSGTTFLHRLLALDPANAGIPFWRLYRPFQLQEQLDLRKVKAWTELNILKPIFPDLQYKHSIRTFLPEETCWMMGQTLHSMVFWILAPVISYLSWLWKQDFSEVYREYSILLGALQTSYPNQRLVLKAPELMPHLDLLLANVPGARIIQLHRDPATCVLSLSSLFYTTHIALSEKVDPRRMVETNLAMTAGFLQANRQARKAPSVDRAVLDIAYEDLVGDPIRTVKTIYEHFNLFFSEDFVARLSGFLKRSNKREQSAHHYSGDQFGLSEAEIQRVFKGL